MDDVQKKLLEGFDERIRAVAKELLVEELNRRAKDGSPGSHDKESDSIRAEQAKIQAKEFITAREAATLLSCSARHIHNMVDRARRGNRDNPIPYRKVGDTTVFRRIDLIEWTEGPGAKGTKGA